MALASAPAAVFGHLKIQTVVGALIVVFVVIWLLNLLFRGRGRRGGRGGGGRGAH
jgi:hypothetical protein